LPLAPLTSNEVDVHIVIVHMGSLDIMDFIAGQQRKHYFIKNHVDPFKRSPRIPS